MSKIKSIKSAKKPTKQLGKSLSTTAKKQNIQNDNTNESSNSSAQNAQETDMQFELELCWCINQLENALQTGKLSTKIAEDTLKNLKILKSSIAPLIKKRQVMKAAMGDYRAKMHTEEKKLSLATKQIKFTKDGATNAKCNFVKKSAILTSGRDFKFNFNPIIENSDNQQLNQQNANEAVKNAEVKLDDCNSKSLNLKDFSLPTGVDFKFNFTIDDVNDDELKFDELSIKN